MTKLNTFARVRALNEWQAVCFSVAMLSRMVPNFELFAEIVALDDPQLLNKVLLLVKEKLNSPKSKINFVLQLEKVELASPDISEYDNFGVYPANDACMGMTAILNLLTKVDEKGAVVVSKLSQGGVEAYLLNCTDCSEEDVKVHPLMVFEVDLQNEILNCVESMPPNSSTIQHCIDIALAENMTNIGLAIN